MKKKDLSRFVPGSAEYVEVHAKWQKSRNKRASMRFNGEKNPEKALMLAEKTLRPCRIAWTSRHTGFSGHGEFMSESLGKAWLEYENKKHGRDIDHHLEYR